VGLFQVPDLFVEFPDGSGGVPGHHDIQADPEVSPPAATQAGHPLADDPDVVARLAPLGDRHGHGAQDAFQRPFPPQHGVVDRDAQFHQQVVPFPLEARVVLDLADHIEVPRLAGPGAAGPGHPQRVAAVHSRGDAHRDPILLASPAGPPALGAGVSQNAPGAPAVGTGGGDREEALAVGHPTVAPAGGANLRGTARGRAASLAGFADHLPGDPDFLLDPRGGFLQGDRHLDLLVPAPMAGTPGGGSPEEASQEVLQPALALEELVEDAEEVLGGWVVAAALQARLSVPVVDGPLFRVRQDVPGLGDGLHLLGRRGIVRVPVRVVLERQASEGLLDLLPVRVAGAYLANSILRVMILPALLTR